MKLTRAHEQLLIGIGLATVLNGLITTPKPTKKKPGAKWSEARRKKFSDTMKKKWAESKK